MPDCDKIRDLSPDAQSASNAVYQSDDYAILCVSRFGCTVAIAKVDPVRRIRDIPSSNKASKPPAATEEPVRSNSLARSAVLNWSFPIVFSRKFDMSGEFGDSVVFQVSADNFSGSAAFGGSAPLSASVQSRSFPSESKEGSGTVSYSVSGVFEETSLFPSNRPGETKIKAETILVGVAMAVGFLVLVGVIIGVVIAIKKRGTSEADGEGEPGFGNEMADGEKTTLSLDEEFEHMEFWNPETIWVELQDGLNFNFDE